MPENVRPVCEYDVVDPGLVDHLMDALFDSLPASRTIISDASYAMARDQERRTQTNRLGTVV